MATAATNALSATMTSVAMRPQKRINPKVNYLPGLNAYQGLGIHNNVVAMSVPLSTEQCFAKFANSVRANKKGGALTSTCNAAVEIFKIASIMNGLVLVGVAVGFVLLRIEASVEEAEAE